MNDFISDEDYHQVFDETVSGIVKALVTQANNAQIKDLDKIIERWLEFYTRRIDK